MAYVDPKAGLVAYLKGNSGVRALVGDRWSPEGSPSDYAFPRGTYQLISYDQAVDLGGPIGYATCRITLKIWGDGTRQGHKQVNEVWKVLMGNGVLHGFRGMMGTSMRVQLATIENAEDAGEAPADGQELGNACASMDVVLRFDQGVPTIVGVNA